MNRRSIPAACAILASLTMAAMLLWPRRTEAACGQKCIGVTCYYSELQGSSRQYSATQAIIARSPAGSTTASLHTTSDVIQFRWASVYTPDCADDPMVEQNHTATCLGPFGTWTNVYQNECREPT